jgi:hypothetical protein
MKKEKKQKPKTPPFCAYFGCMKRVEPPDKYCVDCQQKLDNVGKSYPGVC